MVLRGISPPPSSPFWTGRGIRDPWGTQKIFTVICAGEDEHFPFLYILADFSENVWKTQFWGLFVAIFARGSDPTPSPLWGVGVQTAPLLPALNTLPCPQETLRPGKLSAGLGKGSGVPFAPASHLLNVPSSCKNAVPNLSSSFFKRQQQKILTSPGYLVLPRRLVVYQTNCPQLHDCIDYHP